MKSFNRHYIAGQWQSSSNDTTFYLVNPSNGQTYAEVCGATEELVEHAVAAANRAFDQWQQLGFAKRANYLQRIASRLEDKKQQLVDAIVEELGCPISFTLPVQVEDPISAFYDHVQYAEALGLKYDNNEQALDDRLAVRKEAVGVCALITPWNYPLHQLVAKVAPALCAGCTVVVKPSEYAPQSALLLAEAIAEAELPAGVFNLVLGEGQSVGRQLSQHPHIDCISFTGSNAVGKQIQKLAAETVKRVNLELGGKSAFVITPTTALESAVRLGVEDVMCNSGQTCVALTRMFVHRSQYHLACGLAQLVANELVLGNPADPDTFIGPVVNQAQYERINEYLRVAQAEGADVFQADYELSESLQDGFYIPPTICSNVTNQMRIAQEEIFGPVLCIIAYDSEAEAIALANQSIYGLAARVWADDVEHAYDLARQIRAGLVYVNDAVWHNAAPFGGYKQSGNGRELGLEGINDFLEIKSLIKA
jgi:aldehyde dehydrogenase (NAD+)